MTSASTHEEKYDLDPDGFKDAFNELDSLMLDSTEATRIQGLGGIGLYFFGRFRDWNEARLGFMGCGYTAGADGYYD